MCGPAAIEIMNASADGLTVRAVAGSRAIMLAINAPDENTAYVALPFVG